MLVLANARCLVRCQIDSADPGTPPCHSQSHSQTKVSQDHCIKQHELSASVAPQVVAAVLPDVASSEAFASPNQALEAIEASPPPPPASLNQPLRI